MTQTIEGTYDGTVLRPDTPLQLKANTRVRIIMEALAEETTQTRSFLDTALSLQLKGLPPDLSVNIDHYLYGLDKVEENKAEDKDGK